jgi:peptidoglycan/xylan/chitin deacetylase (PgdA/CDA1 family)
MTDEVVYLRHDLRKEIIDELERILDGEFAGYPSEYDLLTWELVQELSTKGISFGSHTSNHFVLTLEEASVVGKELAESKQELEARIGTPVVTLAYPNGRHNAAVRAAAAAAGYEIALTTENRINRNGCDLLALGRTGLCEESTRGIAGQYSARVGALRLGE